MKKCPFCTEEIQDDAIRCHYCDSFLKFSYEDNAEGHTYDNPIKLAKEEIIDRYGNLNDLPEDVADVITSFYFYKYAEPESEWIDELELKEVIGYTIRMIILKTTDEYIPGQMEGLRNMKNENPEWFNYWCDVLKYSSLYDYDDKKPKWWAVMKTKSQKPYIKVVNGIYKKMNI